MEQKTVLNQNAGYENVTATCQQKLYEMKKESSPGWGEKEAVTKSLFYVEESKVKASPWQEYSYDAAEHYMACSQRSH